MTIFYPTPEHERLAREGMYHPESEGDACGVGLIAATDGKPSRRVVAAGIEALKAVWHRGAVDADGNGRSIQGSRCRTLHPANAATRSASALPSASHEARLAAR
jgi:glutamate synthase domain-containing protein 1